MFSGIRCTVCGMAFELPEYRKYIDREGNFQALYWIDPKLSKHTGDILNFCGPIHSNEWHQAKLDSLARVTTHDNDPEQLQSES